MDIYMRQIWQDDRMAFNEINSTIVLPAKAMENVRYSSLYNHFCALNFDSVV